MINYRVSEIPSIWVNYRNVQLEIASLVLLEVLVVHRDVVGNLLVQCHRGFVRPAAGHVLDRVTTTT